MNKFASGEVITMPKGEGVLQCVGEELSPSLHTGTGKFTVPITLPPRRNGFKSQLNLVYSTCTGNGPLGLGWNLSVSYVSHNGSKCISRYNEAKDDFILSRAKDLVSVETTEATVRYCPRTVASFETGPAKISDPLDFTKAFAWKLKRTKDALNNYIEYERDSAEVEPHHWNQRYLKLGYDAAGIRKFLAPVNFEQMERANAEGSVPDSFSEYRSGFEMRARKQCMGAIVSIHADKNQNVRSYDLTYLDQCPEGPKSTLPVNSVSILSQTRVAGSDGNDIETLPPLKYKYTLVEPEKRNSFPLQGSSLPVQLLANQDFELINLFGNGLPDSVGMNGTTCCWINFGNSQFNFSDPYVKWAELSDDGIKYITLINNSNIGCWLSICRDSWIKRIQKKNCRRFPNDGRFQQAKYFAHLLINNSKKLLQNVANNKLSNCLY